MAITLTETDTASDCAVAVRCSTGSILNSQTSAKLATSGGTAGTTAVSLTLDAINAQLMTIGFFSAAKEPNDGSAWGAGTWTVRVEVTTANMNITAWFANVCRISSSCANIGTVSDDVAGVGDFTTTGVKTATLTGSNATGSESDRITVGISVVNSTTKTQTFAYKPSQNIATPVSLGTGLLETRGSYPPPRAWDEVHIGYNL